MIMFRTIEETIARMQLAGGNDGLRANRMRAALIRGDQLVIEQICWDDASRCHACDQEPHYRELLAMAELCMQSIGS